jgi:hypothetical protein
MAEEMARKIAAMSDDGLEMIEFAFRVFRDPTMPFEDRRWAMEWLADRGAGRAMANVNVGGTVNHVATRVSLEHYTDEELEAHERMRLAAQERARIAQASDANTPKVIDVVPPSTTP